VSASLFKLNIAIMFSFVAFRLQASLID